MTVLHLISSGGMYGAEAVILQLCRQMQGGTGHTGHLGVFALEGQAEPALFREARRAGLQAECIPCKGQLDLKLLGKLQEVAARVGATVVHAHGYKADVYAWLAFRGTQRPALVSTCHTWYDNDFAVRLYGVLDRRVLRSFDRVVAVSAEVHARLLRAGVKADHITLVRNGVEIPVEASRATNSESPVLRVGLVGRLAPEKGVDVFLRAVALLGAEVPAAKFHIAGDGPDRAALEALVSALSVTDRVSLPGQQGDMQAYYASLHLLVSASRQEGLPMALLEGMAAGLPVVATTVGEVPQVVQDGVTGLLVPPDAPEALAEALRRLLLDQDLRLRYGRAGRQRVMEHFSAQRMATDYMQVYTEAMAQQARRQPGRVSAGNAL